MRWLRRLALTVRRKHRCRMSALAFINIHNLSVGYTSQSGEIIRVLRDVSLSINRGESIGLVG